MSLVGESLRALTDEFGRFTLVNVTAGDDTMRVKFLGCADSLTPAAWRYQTVSVSVAAQPNARSQRHMTTKLDWRYHRPG